VRIIKEKAEAIKTANPSKLGNVTQMIPTIQASFPKNVTYPAKVAAEGANRWFEQLRKCHTGLDEWEPYLRKASLFLEFYFGANRSYMDWFNSPDGPRALLQQSEDLVVKNWRSIIETTLKDAQAAGRLRFFCEDFEETAQACETALLLIDSLNQYQREFMKNERFTDQYQGEKEAITKLVAMFRSFPPLRSVDFRTYKGGVIQGKEAGCSEWTFALQHSTPQLKGTVRGQNMLFNCQAPEITSPDYKYGSIIWNTKTWVWYHPSSAYLIRYDWSNQAGMFKFKSTHMEGLPNVIYPDWALKGTSLQCMTEKGKVAPSVLIWEVNGSLPVPAALVAAMAELILDALQLLNVS